jgi:hypothetical protein
MNGTIDRRRERILLLSADSGVAGYVIRRLQEFGHEVWYGPTLADAQALRER